MQALVGKTGKEGLKRCCLQAEPSKINPTAAHRAGTLLSELDLEEVRDVSAGAATFFVWVGVYFFLVIRRYFRIQTITTFVRSSMPFSLFVACTSSLYVIFAKFSGIALFYRLFSTS